MNIKNLKNKKGISTIIASILMIVLVLIATGVLYGIVSNLINKDMNRVEKCSLSIVDQVTINQAYTCHNPNWKRIQFDNHNALPNNQSMISIKVKDVTIDKLLITLTYGLESETFELVDGMVIPNLTNLGATAPNELISLPKKGEVKTYRIFAKTIKIPEGSTFLEKINTDNTVPDSISIIPVIRGEQCGVSDQLNEVPKCKDLFP